MDERRQTTGRSDVTMTGDSGSASPKAVDLFAGCGGLTQGLRDAGFEVVGAVEIDTFAAETFALNHPDVCLLVEDIRRVSPCGLLAKLGILPGGLDLLAACPPCQGFSRMRLNNRRERLSDPRNRLIDEVLRFVEAMRPLTVMVENVPDLGRYTRYVKFKTSLRKLGYCVFDTVVDVADYGVPQRRRRLVLLASQLGYIAPATPLSVARTVRSAIGGELPLVPDDPVHDVTEQRCDRVRRIIAAVPKDGGSRSSLPDDLMLDCHIKHDGFYDVYGRMRWDAVSPTITGGCVNPSRGRFLHPEENRAITLREAALLQTFPPRYRFSLSRGKYATAELIGNALPPAFSAAQAGAIRRHLAQASSEGVAGEP